MGKIYYIMGKSSSGKDTLFRKIKQELPMLQTVTLYTTRPKREGEREGVEYHFVTDEQMHIFERQGKVVELRTYNTVHAITPPGSLSAANFSQHCTACQLCVSVCTNHVLRPSGNLQTFMQPEVSYERGYCRPECVKCSEVCPTGAIRPITKADKTAIQIGHAVLIQENCIVNRDGVTCGNCARHCPTAILSSSFISAPM